MRRVVTWVALVPRVARVARVRVADLRDRAIGLLRRVLPFESQHLFALTIGVGVVCGLVAVAFHLAIKAAETLLIERAMHAPGSSWIGWTILSPTIGGLVAGALLTYVVPGARGSGIPQVKVAFALENGRVRFRDAFGKFCIAALQIGAGASLGREGPTVQICAGATSLLARLTALPAKNQRRLLPVGVAAGIAAAFNAPIAAVTFTIEEIVGSLDHAVLSGVVVAAALAAVIERGVLGVHPIIEVQQTYGLDHASSLGLYAALGVIGGFVSASFTDGLLELRRAFRQLRWVPAWAHPGVGGLVTGLIAVFSFKFLGSVGINGGGYEPLGQALAGSLPLQVLLALGFLKMVATVFSYSSGGAGGIFAPSLFVGAMLGGAVGYLDVNLLHHEDKQLGAFALVGMGAVFAGVVRAPITSVLIIFEMTGGYGLVLPLMLANMTSYVLARRLRPTPIYEALLEQDGTTLPHAEPQVHALDLLTVREVMTQSFVAVDPRETVKMALARFEGRSFVLAPAIDSHGMLVGAVEVARVRSSPADTSLNTLLRPVRTVLSSATVGRAVAQMNVQSTRQLVVLDAKTASRVAGVITVSDVIRAHARSIGLNPASSDPRVSSGGLRDLRAATLMCPSPVVRAAMPVNEFLDKLATSASGVVVVRDDAGRLSVVMAETLRELLRDASLQRLLVAGDLSQPAPIVPLTATFAELVGALSEAGGVIVGETMTQDEVQVVSREALGNVLLKWYVANESAT